MTLASSLRVLGTGEPAPAFFRSEGRLLLAAYQNVPPAPGRESGTVQPSTPAPGGPSPEPGGFMGGIGPLLIMVVPMLLLLFFTSRSQQKRQAATLANLKKGDRVVLDSGIAGRLVELGDRYAKLEIAPGVKVDVLKSKVLGADATEVPAPASAEKK